MPFTSYDLTAEALAPKEMGKVRCVWISLFCPSCDVELVRGHHISIRFNPYVNTAPCPLMAMLLTGYNEEDEQS